jgi:hypothetical protein
MRHNGADPAEYAKMPGYSLSSDWSQPLGQIPIGEPTGLRMNGAQDSNANRMPQGGSQKSIQ